MVYNNLCPVCEAKRLEGIDIKPFSERLKIYPEKSNSDVILVCIHEGDCSILDIGVCACGKRGLMFSPEEQIGILQERNSDVETLHISIDPSTAGVYCDKHYNTQPCSMCGTQTLSITNLTTVEGAQEVCPDCVQQFRLCTSCGEYHTKYDLDLDAFICAKCKPTLKRCTCGRLVTSDKLIPWVGGEFGCSSCLATTICTYCGKSKPTKLIGDDIALCKDHYYLGKDLPRVSGYGHTKASTFLKTSQEGTLKTFLGIEWESQMNITREKFSPRSLPLRKRLFVKAVKAIFPEVECKRDGSLHSTYQGRSYDNGVETVWQPMSFNYIQENRAKFKQMFSEVTSMLHPHMNESGMHIHISKAGFTPFHFLKFTNFFYFQEKQGFMYHIAGRSGNSYARISYASSMDGTKAGPQQTGKRLAFIEAASKHIIKTVARRSFFPERYEAINITNAKTYEIRVFKSPRSYEDFMKNIEYVHSIYAYTSKESIKEMNLHHYFNFVKKSGVYPNLVNAINLYKGDN